ncbi:YdeI family protein [Mangrovimonas sp. TPBH4]|uniref:YdeI/OmpD-associated family protein n=1 Tax=Mangrovimonas sp. TPBH4 TaxID=1645914 RepID=UPI0006B55F19|nr:YdeI/OmpD-associated family protein [Mangrovimonas sp. TPBH4]
MSNIPELYFKSHIEWREWLMTNHSEYTGVYLIFYKVSHDNESMRWEEAVKVALCFGWIDSTVKSLGDGKRRQYFTPRNPKSVWSALNKRYIQELLDANMMHDSGLKTIEIAKDNGSWTALDDVENGIIPDDLQRAFDQNPKAFENYQNFAPSYRKSYLYWLNQAKREATRTKRILEIVQLCNDNIKSRGGY